MTAQRNLSDGELVTLLVGVGLELATLHRSGVVFGPIHPAHVVIHQRGRPGLTPVAAPSGWTRHDDWVALLRFGRHMGGGPRAAALSWESAGRREDVALLRWLLLWSVPKPLTFDAERGVAS